MFTVKKTARYLRDEEEYKPLIGVKLLEMEGILGTSPYSFRNKIKKLVNYQPPYRYRIGPYRVLYDILVPNVYLIAISSRSQAYRKLKYKLD